MYARACKLETYTVTHVIQNRYLIYDSDRFLFKFAITVSQSPTRSLPFCDSDSQWAAATTQLTQKSTILTWKYPSRYIESHGDKGVNRDAEMIVYSRVPQYIIDSVGVRPTRIDRRRTVWKLSAYWQQSACSLIAGMTMGEG
jgi:hypothetical protein